MTTQQTNKKRKVEEEVQEDDIVDTDEIMDQRKQAMKERIEFEQQRLNKLVELHLKEEELKQKEEEIQVMMSMLSLSSGETSSSSDTTSQIPKRMHHNLKELLEAQKTESQIRINVGGQLFVTTEKTINSCENLLKVMCSTDVPIDTDSQGAMTFPDQNPTYFSIILDFLQAGGDNKKVSVDETLSIEQLGQLLEEAEFFGAQDLARRVKALIDDVQKEEESQNMLPVVQPDRQEDTTEVVLSEKLQDILKKQDDWISDFHKLTISQKQIDEQYFVEKSTLINQKLTQIQEKKQSLLSKNDYQLKVSVRGRQFAVAIDVLQKHPDCILNKALPSLQTTEPTIFVDKDPDNFATLLLYMQTNSTDHFPHNNIFMLKRLQRDAKYYNLPQLLNTYFNKFRYPVESIGKRNIEIKQRDDLLRKLFATDRENPVLADPFISLHPIFDAPKSELEMDNESQSIPMLFNFEDPFQNKIYHEGHPQPLKPILCKNFATFLDQWDAFTYGLTEGLDWNNLFAAGGGVLASALTQGPPKASFTQTSVPSNNDTTSDDAGIVDFSDDSDNETVLSDDVFSDLENEGVQTIPTSWLLSGTSSGFGDARTQSQESLSRAKRLANTFNQGPWKSSDIDFFIYALDEVEAEKKIQHMYDTFKKNLQENKPAQFTDQFATTPGNFFQQTAAGPDPDKDDIFMLRTKAAVTFHFKYPIRPIQVILRIYKSPAEVLLGFDIDSVCIGFDGKQLWSAARCRRAIANRMNLVDVDRQSTTFEIRLYKYAKRGFRVGVPGFHRGKVINSEVEIQKRTEKISARSRRYRRYQPPTPTVSQTSGAAGNLYNKYFGLARLLLLERSLTEEPRKSLSSIGLPNDMEKAPAAIATPPFLQREIEKASKKSDYGAIHIGFSTSLSPKVIAAHFTSRVSFFKQLHADVLKNPSWVPQFIYSLNDPVKIITGKGVQSSLSPNIEWITLDAGRQSIGSFHPTDRNFFKDAYSKSQQQVHHSIAQSKEANLRKLYKVKYEIKQRRHALRTLSKEEGMKVEVAYRQYQKSRTEENRFFTLNQHEKIDFQTMTVTDSSAAQQNYYYYYRTKTLVRTKTYVSAEKRFYPEEFNALPDDDVSP